jgi:hypothetical protein
MFQTNKRAVALLSIFSRNMRLNSYVALFLQYLKNLIKTEPASVYSGNAESGVAPE